MNESKNQTVNMSENNTNYTHKLTYAIPYIIIGIIMSISCYYVDQARIAAFVMVPYVTLHLSLKEIGYTRKTYPRTVFAIYSLFMVYALIITFYVLDNPIIR